MELLNIILTYIVAPVLCWVWYIDRELVKIKATQIQKEDIDKLTQKIDELKDEIHSKNTA